MESLLPILIEQSPTIAVLVFLVIRGDRRTDALTSSVLETTKTNTKALARAGAALDRAEPLLERLERGSA